MYFLDGMLLAMLIVLALVPRIGAYRRDYYVVETRSLDGDDADQMSGWHEPRFARGNGRIIGWARTGRVVYRLKGRNVAHATLAVFDDFLAAEHYFRKNDETLASVTRAGNLGPLAVCHHLCAIRSRSSTGALKSAALGKGAPRALASTPYQVILKGTASRRAQRRPAHEQNAVVRELMR